MHGSDGLSVLVHRRTRRREQAFMRNFRGIRDEAADGDP
jgi:hypothetical protein